MVPEAYIHMPYVCRSNTRPTLWLYGTPKITSRYGLSLNPPRTSTFTYFLSWYLTFDLKRHLAIDTDGRRRKVLLLHTWCNYAYRKSELSIRLFLLDLVSTSMSQVNSVLHPSGLAKLSTSFGWGTGEKVTTAGWPVTLCDPIWHVISRSAVW